MSAQSRKVIKWEQRTERHWDSGQRFILLSLVAVASCLWFFVTLVLILILQFAWFHLHLCEHASWQPAAIVQTGKICWYLPGHEVATPSAELYCTYHFDLKVLQNCWILAGGGTCPLQVLVHWMWCETCGRKDQAASTLQRSENKVQKHFRELQNLRMTMVREFRPSASVPTLFWTRHLGQLPSLRTRVNNVARPHDIKPRDMAWLNSVSYRAVSYRIVSDRIVSHCIIASL